MVQQNVFAAYTSTSISATGGAFGGHTAHLSSGGGSGGGVSNYCDPGNAGLRRKTSYNCGVSFRIYKTTTNIRQDALKPALQAEGISNLDLVNDTGATATITVDASDDGNHIDVYGWRSGGNQIFEGGDVNGCGEAGYYIRLGYDLAGGRPGSDWFEYYNYQVGLPSFNAWYDQNPDLSKYDRQYQSLKGIDGFEGYLDYNDNGAKELGDYAYYLPDGESAIDYPKLMDEVDNMKKPEQGFRVTLELAARIFWDLGTKKVSSGKTLLEDDWITDFTNAYPTDAQPLLHAHLKNGGQGVGAICADFKKLTNQAREIYTKSGVEYAEDEKYSGYENQENLVRSAWTNRNLDKEKRSVQASYELNQTNYRDKFTVRFRHAILFNLEQNRPADACMNFDTVGYDYASWPVNDPAVDTPFKILATDTKADKQQVTSVPGTGELSTSCRPMTDNYSNYPSSERTWRRGNQDDSGSLWVYDLMRTYTFDLTSIKKGGRVTRCERIYVKNKGLKLAENGELQYEETNVWNGGNINESQSGEYTEACFVVEVKGDDTPPHVNTPTGPGCYANSGDAEATTSYGNTTGFSGVQNLTTKTGWRDTSKKYNSLEQPVTIGGRSYANRYVYAKPGDSVQFHHCLTYGAQMVGDSAPGTYTLRDSNGYTIYPREQYQTVPRNWFDLSVNVTTTAGDDRETRAQKYLFRNLNKYTQNNTLTRTDKNYKTYDNITNNYTLQNKTRFYLDTHTARTSIPKQRYIRDRYLNNSSYNYNESYFTYYAASTSNAYKETANFSSDFGSGNIKNYALMMESPSINTAGYDCKLYTTTAYGGIQQIVPGYQVHGLYQSNTSCNASRTNDNITTTLKNGTTISAAGVDPSDVGKTITQKFSFNYIHAWVDRWYEYWGACTGCDGEHTAGGVNHYNLSYSSAKSHSSRDGTLSRSCSRSRCNCSTNAEGKTCCCHPYWSTRHSVRQREVVSNYNYYDCQSIRYARTSGTGTSSDSCSGRIYHTRSTEYGIPIGYKSATVKVPYNFTTKVYARNETASSGAPAGGTVTSTVTMMVKPRVNVDVNGNTAYATMMPKKSKVQVIEFVIDDSVSSNVLNRTGENGGINGGYSKSNPCAYFDAVISKDIGCTTITSTTRDGATTGFNRNSVLKGEGTKGSESRQYYQETFTRNVPDIEVGQKYCVAIGVWPADSHNILKGINSSNENVEAGQNEQKTATGVRAGADGLKDTGNYWNISRASCTPITKSPSAQVWNGDTKTQKITTALSNKKLNARFGNVSNSNRRLFGSWDEHNVIANTITNFASGAALGYATTFNAAGGMAVTQTTVSATNACDFSPLTIANTNCSRLGRGGSSTDDLFATSSIVTKIRSRYLEPVKTKGATSTSINSIRNNVIATNTTANSTQKNYYYLKSDGDLTISKYTFPGHRPSDAANADPTYVIYVNGTLTIDGNLCYQGNTSCDNRDGQVPLQGTSTNFDAKPGFTGRNDYDNFYGTNGYTLLSEGYPSYNNIADLPQVLIFAKDIKIGSRVTQIDAWLFAIGNNIASSKFNTANGTLHTCAKFRQGSKASGDLNRSTTAADEKDECGYQLVINGPVFAKNIYLERTAGNYPGTGRTETHDYDPTAQSIANDGSVTPAEIFNLRPDTYLWAYGQAQDTRQASSTYIRELPPRY